MTPLPIELKLLAAGEAVPFLREITIIVLAAAVFGYLCQRLGIVPIVGFLLAGVLIGPGGLGRFLGFGEQSETIAALAEYGVILLLFTIGLEFSLDKLAAIKTLIFGGGGLQVLGTIGLVTLATLPFLDWRAAVFTGCLVSLSSTAIVLKLLADGARTNTPPGQASLGILIFQDLAVVAMVMLVPMLAPVTEGEKGGGGGAGGLLMALGIAVAVIAVVLLLARKVVPVLLEFVARTCRGEIFLLSVIAICVTTAYLTSLAGVSAALGAFLGGLVVSESKFRHHAFGEIMPLQILFSAAFFVSVGMLLDPMFVVDNALLVAAAVVGVLALKTGVTTLALRAVGRSWRESAAVGLMLGQVGEFAFVLGTAGVAAGLLPMGRIDGFDLFIASSVVLMLATPPMFQAGWKLAGKTAERGETDAGQMSGHVVIVGLGDGGKRLASHLRHAKRDHAIITLDPHAADEAEAAGSCVIRGATDRSPSFESAGAGRAALVVIADDDAETTARATAVARWWADHGGNGTRVVARVRDAAEHEAVAGAGADEVTGGDDDALIDLVRD